MGFVTTRSDDMLRGNLVKLHACHLILLGAFATSSVHAADITPLAQLINQRLSYMKDVAGAKAARHLAIENMSQEQNVLDTSAAEAAAVGLDPDSIKPFIQAEIDAAKAIQYRYRAEWLATPEPGWQPMPLDEVRLRIAEINHAIILGLKDYLQEHRSNSVMEHFRFMHAVEQKYLKPEDKEHLYQTLKDVRLKSPSK